MRFNGCVLTAESVRVKATTTIVNPQSNRRHHTLTLTLFMTLSSWPLAERPRERLLAHGAQTLSDAELLAVLLGTGTRGKSAIDVARELLERIGGIGGLCGLGDTPSANACRVPGLGTAKFAQLRATMELARRAIAAPLARGDVLESPTAVRAVLQLALRGRPHEVFMVIFLDAQHRTITTEELFRGTLAQTSVYPREVVKAALAHNAAAVIFAHNHPSGVAEPSASDQALTRALRDALALVEVRVLDHLIVAGPHCLSFSERGLL
jgi:DNA repair protein RadC